MRLEHKSFMLVTKNVSRILMFGLMLLNFSCRSSPLVDYSKIRSWSPGLQSSYPKEPFLKRFEKNGKELFFIAADHSKDIKSSTHQLIQQVFDSKNPKLIILEGVTTDKGINPQRVVDYIKSSPALMNEGSFAASLAIHANIPFIGGEAPSLEIKHSILAHGHSVKNFVTFLLLRGFASFNKSHPDLNLTMALSKCYSYLENEYKLSIQEIVEEQEFLSISKELLGK